MKGLAFYFFAVLRFERLKGRRNKAYGCLRHFSRNFLFLVNRVGWKRSKSAQRKLEIGAHANALFCLPTLLLHRVR